MNTSGSLSPACRQKPFRLRSARRAFTLIELLVVITVIGILLAILIPTISGLFVTADDFQRQLEIEELGSAIEVFKNEYGFIPPDFRTINNAQDMLPYLQKISPNHQELADDPIQASRGNTGVSRLQVWWNNIGVKLKDQANTDVRGHETALWFWLTQLYDNAQYPLTSARDTLDTPQDGDPVDLTQLIDERKVFFEFQQDRLHNIYEDLEATTPSERIYYPDPDNTSDTNPTGTPNRYTVVHYEQVGGGEAPYIYYHHSSYGLQAACFEVFEDGDSLGWVAPYKVPLDNFNTPTAPPASADFSWPYYGAETYQIIAAGNDGFFGDPMADEENEQVDFRDNHPTPALRQWSRTLQLRTQGDNVTSFSEGRVETMEVVTAL